MAVAALLGEALRATGSPRGAGAAAGARCRARSARRRRLHRHLARRHDARDDPRARRGARGRRGDRDDRRPRDDSPIAAGARITSLVTPLRDRSWCHTVAYTSTILAGAAIARRDRGRRSAETARAIVRDAGAAAADRTSSPRGSTGASRILAVGLGRRSRHGARARAQDRGGRAHRRDRAAARVAAARPPGRLRRRHDGLVLFAADPRPGARRDDRLAVRRGRGARDRHPDRRDRRRGGAGGPPGRRRAPRRCPTGGTVAGALLAGAVALQLLTLELAHLAGQQSRPHPPRAARLSRGRGRGRDARRLVSRSFPATTRRRRRASRAPAATTMPARRCRITSTIRPRARIQTPGGGEKPLARSRDSADACSDDRARRIRTRRSHGPVRAGPAAAGRRRRPRSARAAAADHLHRRARPLVAEPLHQSPDHAGARLHARGMGVGPRLLREASCIPTTTTA